MKNERRSVGATAEFPGLGHGYTKDLHL